jgi:hypothetical protein
VEACSGKKRLPWDFHLDEKENFRLAAKAFAESFGWKGRLVGGHLPGKEGGMAWVFDEPTKFDGALITAFSCIDRDGYEIDTQMQRRLRTGLAITVEKGVIA